MATSAFILRPITPEGTDFTALLDESLSNGHGMLRRLDENWQNGANRFSRPGEIVLGAFRGEALLGVCGRNIDPYADAPRIGRVRHLYVTTDHRRSGVGRRLVEAIIADAGGFFDVLNARAPVDAFAFYERLGFTRVTDEDAVTHRLLLGK